MNTTKGIIIRCYSIGQRSICSIETLDVIPAKQSDKGKTCVCGHVISIVNRKAFCSCGNPRYYQ